MVGASDIPPPSTGYLLGHVAMKWRIAVDRALAPLGLTGAQYALLASLYGLTQAGLHPSQRELADFAGLEPMSVSKLARSLERAGLVERPANRADPRAVQLTITARGRETLGVAVETVHQLHDRLLAPLGGSRGKRKAEFDEALESLLHHLIEVNHESAASAADPAPRRSR